jgi:hypothetical protein
MISSVFRHHLYVIGNGDPVIEFRMAGGFLLIFRFQSPQQPHIGVAVKSIECDQLRG